MPPLQMTRAEYEAKYGTKPVVASSTLDNDPIPVRMTRAEYDAKYRPEEKTGFKADIKSTIGNIQSTLEQDKQDRQRIRTEVESGQTSPEMGTFKTLGKGLSTGFSTLFQGAVGAAKAVLPQGVQDKIGGAVESTVKGIEGYNQRFVEDLKNSEDQKDRETGQKIEEIVNLYKTDQSFRDTVDAAGGILEAVTSVVGIGPTKKVLTSTVDVASDVKKVIKDTSNKFSPFNNDNRITKVVDEIDAIENKYAPTRRKADLDPNVNDSRVRIATSNVLNNAVDEDGLIRTKVKGGAVDEYRKQTIDGVEDVVKRNLEVEGKKVNLNEVKVNMLDAVTNSGLEGADLAAALKRVSKDIAGLTIRADEFGDVMLDKIQDFKTSIYKHIDYTKPTGVTYRKTIARAVKETIENKSDLPVKEWNSELAKYYKDLDRIADLDGKRVKGGRLGKYTASLAGSAVGGVAGAAAGAPGALVGGLVGGEISGFLQGKAMARTFKKGVKGDIPENKILADAKARADAGIKDLRTPDRPVGIKSELLNDPNIPDAIKKEAVKVEGQIKSNIKQQQIAIKAGDFTLVESLKEVYSLLTERLIEIYNKIKDVVKDERGFANFFDGETPKNYRNKSLMSDQKKAIKAPKTAQSISNKSTPDTITVKGDIEDNLITEARKYPTKEEFVKDVSTSEIRYQLRGGLDKVAKETDVKSLTGSQKTGEETVAYWKKRIEENIMTPGNKGTEGFAPIIVDGNKVVDGFHKLQAYKELGFEKVPTIDKSQLEEIWNKANQATPEASLITEARKYPTKEAFVKSKPLAYHGTTENLKRFDKRGTWFTDDYMNADGYASGENIYEGYLDLKNPLVIDGKGKKWDDLNTPYGKTTQEIVGKVDQKKYDGIIFKNIKDNWIDDADAQDAGTVMYAFNPQKSFLNESQLEEIWNKANEAKNE